MINRRITQTLAKVAFSLAIAFLGLLIALHFLEPEFNPSWRMISEYELGKYGLLMSLAFFCWGGGFLSLLISVWHSLNSIGGYIGRWWLFIISIVLFGAGIFITQPITDTVRGTTDKLHAACGVIMIFTFPIVAFLLSRSLSRNQEFKSSQRQLFWITFLVWIGFLSFFGSLIIYHPGARELNEDVLIGWPNRFMVLTYTIWLLAIARIQMQNSNKRKPDGGG